MTHKTSQREQIEHLLRVHGSVHSFELRRIFIGNPSQRIAELEARGWEFRHVDEKLNGDAYGTRYVMLIDPEGEFVEADEKKSNTTTSSPPSTQSEPPRLFEHVAGEFSFATQEEAFA